MELPSPTPTATPTATATATATGLPAPYPASSSSFSGGSIAAGLLLVALAAAALVLARRRRNVPRLIEIVESASLGPKRSLVVARLGDEVLVLGSSEGGITLLATRSAAALASTSTTAATTATATNSSATPSASPVAGAALGLIDRLKRWPRPDAARSFDAALAESVEDVELRRKLAAGRAGSVR